MKILIDSDVCLDFITGRRPHAASALKLFSKLEQKSAQAVISPHSFSNMFYILHSQYNVPDIIASLMKLRLFAGVARLAETEIDQALDSQWGDFEDAIQYQVARASGCDAIITRNVRDFSESTLPVYTPIDYLDQQN